MRDDRGQMQTIEGVTAAFIVVFVLVVVVQTTSVTPLSSSFTNQHIKLELQNIGNDILTTLDDTRLVNTTDPATASLLKQSVINWAIYSDYSMFAWNNTTYVCLTGNSHSSLDTPLTNAIKFALVEKGIAFNLEARYPDGLGNVRTSKIVWNGDPSENSVTVSRFVVLHDSDSEIPVGPSYDDINVLPDISPETNLHNTVEVRLTLWVM